MMKATKLVDKIASYNTSFLKNKFNYKVSEIGKKFLNICWTPKLRKNLTRARFIIAAPKCSVKPLLKVVTVVLKLKYEQTEN